jgi:hypothetical protein
MLDIHRGDCECGTPIAMQIGLRALNTWLCAVGHVGERVTGVLMSARATGWIDYWCTLRSDYYNQGRHSG